MRQQLTQLLSKMEGNDKLEQLLADVLEQHREGQGPGQADGHRRRAADGTRNGGDRNEYRRTSPGRRRGRADDRGRPEPARPGHRRHPAAERPGSRSAAKDYFQQFLDQVVKPGQVVSKDVETNIKYWIGEIDKKLSAQLNEVMHHPDFQKLEGDLARPALPGPPVARPARPSRSAS